MGAVWKVSGCCICRLYEGCMKGRGLYMWLYVGCMKGEPDPVALTLTLTIDVVTKDRPLAM